MKVRILYLTKGEASAWVTRAQRAENANVGVDMEGSESLVPDASRDDAAPRVE